MTLVVGLTGGIASGKSTVADMFKQLNIPVIDADKIAREVVLPGEKTYDKIVKTFGEAVLHEDQTLNRKKLGEIIFADEAKRKQLNALIHPAIRKRMLKRRDQYIAEREPCIVLDIPLLFESKLTHFVEKVIVVYIDEATQLERLMQRDGLNEKEAKQRIQAQLPLKEKAKLADGVIDNHGTIEETRTQLLNLLIKWQVYQ